MAPLTGFVTQTEPKRAADIVKHQIGSNEYCREGLAIKADEGLECGDICETVSSEQVKVATAGNAGSIFIGQKETALEYATADLTFGANATDGKKVTIGGVDYVFESATLSVPGHINIGTDADASLDNLMACINAGGGGGTPGTDYYTATVTPDANVSAEVRPDDVLRLRALVPGTAGNAITCTTDVTSATLTGATLSGGQATDPATGVFLVRGAVVDASELNYNGKTVATVNTALKAATIIPL